MKWDYRGSLIRLRRIEDNCKMACKRLQSLEKRLDRDLVLKERYNVALKEMEDTGVIEEVPTDQLSGEGPTFYLPHRPVVREARLSSKVRPVFDASAKGPNNVSLNDCLEVGPNLIPSLVGILVRFRRWPVAVVADIRKAFLQISVRKEDQGVLRFLWEQDGIIRVMRIVRVPFGCCSSPFILNAVIQHHLDKFESTRVIEELQENLYVHDWLTGAEDELEAKAMIKEASQVMTQASMFLTKWESNKSVVVDKAESSDFVKVLGIVWRAKEHDFSFEGLEVDSDLCITKRVVLSLIARLFDPLGFLSPYVIGLKCLFQDLWRLGLTWDEVPDEVGEQVRDWVEGLTRLRGWKVPRCYTRGRWKDIVDIELHVFGDASEKAYGTCVYIYI